MKYIVTGRVHPERTAVYFAPIRFANDGGGSFPVHCEASQITVVADDPPIDGYVSADEVAEALDETFSNGSLDGEWLPGCAAAQLTISASTHAS